MKHDADWYAIRRAYRAGVFKVLDDIRNGTVAEEDLCKLNNFCAVSLHLMSKVQQPVWRICEHEAELASELLKEVENIE
jgi:hypothetical protein